MIERFQLFSVCDKDKSVVALSCHTIPKSPFSSILFPPNINPLGLDLILKMLHFAPDDRISVEAACLPVFEGFSQDVV